MDHGFRSAYEIFAMEIPIDSYSCVGRYNFFFCSFKYNSIVINAGITPFWMTRLESHNETIPAVLSCVGEEIIDINIYKLIRVGNKQFISIIDILLCSKHGACGAFRNAIYLDNLKIPTSCIFEDIIEVIFFNMLPLANEDKTMIAFWFEIFDDDFYHRLSAHINKGFWEGISCVLKAGSSTCHGDYNIKHAFSVMFSLYKSNI